MSSSNLLFPGFKMVSLAIIFVVTVISCLLYIHLSHVWSTLYKRIEKMYPGPKPLPLIGNGHLFRSAKESFYKYLLLCDQYDRFFRVYIGNVPFIVLYDYRDIEAVLSSNVKLDKGSVYQFLYPWIGRGLLTSAGEKWKTRRRLITPAFHFKILEEYIDLFNANGTILCQKLSQYSGKGAFNVNEWVKLYALDNICETAMKYQVNALINSESTYVKATRALSGVIIKRSFTFYLYNDFLFNMSKYGKIQREAIKVISGTTKKIIKGKARATC
ncbi:UNVERIFIED_CONTAM: hypothetical protein PYX00_004472 [Menopon gallinae]|uniref:Cytochrome P450 n=1 Tax=Menopon gallinae TaxID=328185 RepID=A0AAW2I4L2_9NEOP